MLAVSSLDGAQLLLRAEELRDSGSGRPVCEVTLCHRKGRKVGVVCVAMATMLILDSAVGAVMAEHRLMVHSVSLSLLITYLLLTVVLSVYKESVVVVGGLGVQRKTMYWCGFSSHSFVPLRALSDVIINEAVAMHRVIFYLAIVEKGKDPDSKVHRVVPLFVNLNPQLTAIKPVYHTIRRTLYPFDNTS